MDASKSSRRKVYGPTSSSSFKLDLPLTIDSDDAADLSLALDWVQQGPFHGNEDCSQEKQIFSFQRSHTGYVDIHDPDAPSSASFPTTTHIGKYSAFNIPCLTARLSRGFYFFNCVAFSQSLAVQSDNPTSTAEFKDRIFTLSRLLADMRCPVIVTFFATNNITGKKLRLTVAYDTSVRRNAIRYRPTTSIDVFCFAKSADIAPNIYQQLLEEIRNFYPKNFVPHDYQIFPFFSRTSPIKSKAVINELETHLPLDDSYSNQAVFLSVINNVYNPEGYSLFKPGEFTQDDEEDSWV